MEILEKIRETLDLTVPKEEMDMIFTTLQERYPQEDPWGLNLEKARKSIEYIWPLYKKYFRTRVFGKENVEDKPYLVTSNHSGQIAIDGVLVATAFATEVKPPRILRAMVERFFNTIPFVGTFGAEGGAVLGDRQNCLNLLNRGESVLVFPEGVRGVAKSTEHYYELQRFTRGFFRMALSANVDILPIAVVGAEEVFPWVYQAKDLAKFLGLPALPLTPLYFPLPSPIDIHIGKPYKVPSDLSPDSTDDLIDVHIENIQKEIRALMKEGLKTRRKFFANIIGPKK